MSLNTTPSGERIHIGFFGMRNAGKSSLVNAVTGQNLAVVSPVKGTTTDPVMKAMELLPLGPVMIIDTPGFDDEGSLGELRVQKTKQILNRSDIAVMVIDSTVGVSKADIELVDIIKERKIPYIIVFSKCESAEDDDIKAKYSEALKDVPAERMISVSSSEGTNINELKELMASLSSNTEKERHLVSDLLNPGDTVVLVIPIDKSAPKGRLILPQQQVIRDLLDNGNIVMTVRETELEDALKALKTAPALVITDSQVFGKVNKIVPQDIPLTSFSILMARYKGFLKTAIEGVQAIRELQDGDKILISEGCTHHRQCEDIGTVKIPYWLRDFTKKDFVIETSSGRDFPEDLSEYKLVIHCGGCMLNEKEVEHRRDSAVAQNIPFMNYGTTIAFLNGILERSIQIIPKDKL